MLTHGAMGYTTTFEGHFTISPPLGPDQVHYLTEFSRTRRMRRDATRTEAREDKARMAVGLPVGVEGEFFVGEGGHAGQARGLDILDYNEPPSTQPGLWCQWEPTEGGSRLEWNGSEKFYYYKEWLVYLIDNFLEPWGRSLSGTVSWEGEDSNDYGQITVVDSHRVRYREGTKGYSEWRTV